MDTSRYKLIKNLCPVGLKFNCYGDRYYTISNSPKLWSGHKYHPDCSYNYTVIICDNKMLLELKSVCPKDAINFQCEAILIEEYTEMLQKYGHIRIPVSIEITDTNMCKTCIRENPSCKAVLNMHSSRSYVYIYFDDEKVKEAVDYYINYKDYKEEMTMNELNNVTGGLAATNYNNGVPNTNGGFDFLNGLGQTNGINIFGMQLEFGIIKDPDIASTLLGTCLLNPDNEWVRFDPSTGSLVNIGNAQLGNFPLMAVPAKNVAVGDLIKYKGEKVFVTKIDETPAIEVFSPALGQYKKITPEKNLLGLQIFTKIVCILSPDKLLGGDSSDLTLIMAMSQNGNNNQLSSLMALKFLAGNGSDSPLDIFSGSGDISSNLSLLLLMNGQNGGNGNDALNSILALSMLGKGNNVFGNLLPEKITVSKEKEEKEATSEIPEKNANIPNPTVPAPNSNVDVEKIIGSIQNVIQSTMESVRQNFTSAIVQAIQTAPKTEEPKTEPETATDTIPTTNEVPTDVTE